MDNKIEVTETEISNLLILLLDTVEENKDFFNLNIDYTNCLEFKSLKYWENEINKLSRPDCKILIPMAIVKAVENSNDLNIGKVVSFIKFILTLTVRFFNKISDLKCINNLVFLACDNIDTWLLRNLSLRPMSFLNPANKTEIDKWVNNNFLLYADAVKDKINFIYKDIGELIDFVLDIKTKIQLEEPLEEDEVNTLVNIIADKIRILMEKARYHKGSIGICSYCNNIYYYTNENKLSNQFLMLSPINELCSECFIEANKEAYNFRDMYIKTFNKETNKDMLRYLVFSTNY